MQYDFSHYQAAAEYIRAHAPFVPDLAIVLGSCLGPFAETLENPVAIDYADIPNFLLTTVESHAGKLVFGTVQGKRVVCMSGRFHFYEGYAYEQLVLPVRVLKLLGVRALILTNAAGAVNEQYRPGDVMILSDHIKLTGASPLRGPNLDAFGPRFFDMTQAYTPALRAVARECAKRSSLTVHEGVYMFFTGPQFETPAEIRAARVLGADAVGMSTVTETLTAAHCGLPVLALSVMTNMAAGVLEQPLSEQEVEETATRIAAPFSAYVKDIIAHISLGK